jgi:hypothetical protein
MKILQCIKMVLKNQEGASGILQPSRGTEIICKTISALTTQLDFNDPELGAAEKEWM